MKRIFQTVAAICLTCLPSIADDAPAPEDLTAKHAAGSEKVADQQDELSADVGQLIIEQTVPKVIELLDGVSTIMDESTDKLTDHDTGSDTLAAQTEIIEKIHEAAKERQKQSGAGQAGSAMMDMMERMMGKEPGGDKPGKGDKPGDTGGQGMTGDSDAANGATAGAGGGKVEVRTVPKASGSAGRELPEEFRKAMDAYNRGAEQKVK